MEVRLYPTLNALEKFQLSGFIINVLSNPELCVNDRTPRIDFSQKLCLYYDNRMHMVALGREYYWELGLADYCNIGRPSNDVTLNQRLTVLVTLAQYCDLSAELAEAIKGAIGHYLVSEYNALTVAALTTPLATGLAFNGVQSAALIDGEWLLPSGEVVSVDGSEWTVCASVLPVPAPVVETDVQF